MADPEVVDEAALDRLIRIGGQDFLLEMIDLFLANAPERLRAARAAFEARDIQGLFRAAHSLKSTSANLGARRLQEAAQRTEARAAEEDLEGVAPLLDRMSEDYEEVRRLLQTERMRRSGE